MKSYEIKIYSANVGFVAGATEATVNLMRKLEHANTDITHMILTTKEKEQSVFFYSDLPLSKIELYFQTALDSPLSKPKFEITEKKSSPQPKLDQ